MGGRPVLVVALLAAMLSGPAALASHPPLHEELIVSAGEHHYAYASVWDPFTNLEVLAAWAINCTGFGYDSDCPVPPVGGDRLELWEETNNVVGLQRSETCADGSSPATGVCADDQDPIPPDMLLLAIA